jgi:DHA1 family tetracycline resistance protein-like MFS transporter
VPSFAAAGLSTVSFFCVLLVLPESLTPERRAALAVSAKPAVTAAALFAALRRPVVGPLLTTRLAISVTVALLQSTFALWASSRTGYSTQSASLVLGYVGVMSVVMQGLLVGILASRFAERTLIVGGLAVLAASLLAWAFAPGTALLLVAFGPVGLAGGMLNVVLTSSLTKAVARDEVGGTLGLAAALQSIAFVAAPAIGGALLQQVGPWSLGAFEAAMLAGTAVLAAAAIPRPQPVASGRRECLPSC